MVVIKRDGKSEEFNIDKVINAVTKAYRSQGYTPTPRVLAALKKAFVKGDTIGVEEIQDKVENILMNNNHKVAKAFILYRQRHSELRFIAQRAEYIEQYVHSNDNAATASEIDANANIQNKNVATLEAELYKSANADLSRYRVTKKLKEMYGEDAPDYIKDLESHVVYKHDEGSAPAIKPYCVAVNMYPFLNKGTATLDKLDTEAPHNMNSFTGQFNNLAFLLSSQFQGAVAFGEFFNTFYYYCVMQWGKRFWERDQDAFQVEAADPKRYSSWWQKLVLKMLGEPFIFDTKKTISQAIEQAFQNIIYTINQPAGNRSYQSPFTNISYYDKNYWDALFKDFVYPDGTKPEWEGIDYLQKKFMRWFNNERSKTLLTFPVETMALLTDGKEVIDQDYANFTAEMQAAGHSFFVYMSDNADALSSCCRLKNKLDKNEFSFTNGLTGVATGSKSVITLNLNRITQNFVNLSGRPKVDVEGVYWPDFKSYLIDILKRVYKYHAAYNELLWDLYDHDMLPVYKEGYINLNQQFLTIGINGVNEAAEFLGITVSDNPKYQEFCNLITSTISEQNRIAERNPYNKKHVLKFNTEFVPAENLAIKNYNWDKQDGYWVPTDRNLYNSYFYKPEDKSIDILQKFRLHGKRYVDSLDGGVALHCNLEEHLTKEQYLKLMKYAIENGTNYYTFNIPNSKCEKCGYISKHPIKKCPKCGSEDISWWTRIIGYLRPIKGFSKGRRIEADRRYYANGKDVC